MVLPKREQALEEGWAAECWPPARPRGSLPSVACAQTHPGEDPGQRDEAQGLEAQNGCTVATGQPLPLSRNTLGCWEGKGEKDQNMLCLSLNCFV